jgi:TolB-like protein/Flp pilus assembly protein TadD
MPSPQPHRLDSWKAIAEYLGRSVRTVVRWGEDRGLPIHRIPGGKRHAIFAYPEEIDAWLLSKGDARQTAPPREETATNPESAVSVSSSSKLPALAERSEMIASIRHPDSPLESVTRSRTHQFWNRNARWVLAGASVLICLVASIFVFASHYSHAETSTKPPRFRIAVLPVHNLTGDTSCEIFADGLTEELITQLGRLNPQEMGVIARSSSMSYKYTDKTLAQITRELGVDYVLESSMRGNLNQFRFNAQLIRTRDQSPLWSQNYDRTVDNLILLEYELTRDIARGIGLHTTPEASARLNRSLSITPDSHLAVLQGRYYWNQRTKESLDRGLEYFQLATEVDPRNALAYSGMADSYNMLVFYNYSAGAAGIVRAEESAQHALALDSSLAEAHASLAYVNFMWTWEWPSAEREFRRAIELDANYVPAHHWYALYLASMGRHAEADREIRTALNLDPYSAVVQSAAGYVHYFAKEYDIAIQDCQTVLQRDPSFIVAHSVLGLGYEGKGQYAQAISEFRKVEELSGGHVAYYKGLLGHAYAMAGNDQGARKILGDLNAMAIEGNYASQTSKATIYAGLREKENALGALERALDQNDASMIWLGVDSRFDLLRAEPRFQVLLKAQGRLP